MHVCVKVTPELQGMYWNRHDRTSFNIMAICDICCSQMFGMEPHDLVIIHQFLRWRKTMILNFRYHHRISIMLLDSGYPNKQGFLAPYRSSRNMVVRYHMSQFENAPPPRNKQEFFNRWHASLRSVI